MMEATDISKRGLYLSDKQSVLLILLKHTIYELFFLLEKLNMGKQIF